MNISNLQWVRWPLLIIKVSHDETASLIALDKENVLRACCSLAFSLIEAAFHLGCHHPRVLFLGQVIPLGKSATMSEIEQGFIFPEKVTIRTFMSQEELLLENKMWNKMLIIKNIDEIVKLLNAVLPFNGVLLRCWKILPWCHSTVSDPCKTKNMRKSRIWLHPDDRMQTPHYVMKSLLTSDSSKTFDNRQ